MRQAGGCGKVLSGLSRPGASAMNTHFCLLLLEDISLLPQASVQTAEQKVFLQEMKTLGAEPEPSASHPPVKARLKCEPAEWEAPEEQGKGKRRRRESRAKGGLRADLYFPPFFSVKSGGSVQKSGARVLTSRCHGLSLYFSFPPPIFLETQNLMRARQALELSKAHPQPPFFLGFILFCFT